MFNIGSTYFLLWGLDCKFLVRTAAFQTSRTIGHKEAARLIGWHWSAHGQLNPIFWKRRSHEVCIHVIRPELLRFRVQFVTIRIVTNILNQPIWLFLCYLQITLNYWCLNLENIRRRWVTCNWAMPALHNFPCLEKISFNCHIYNIQVILNKKVIVRRRNLQRLLVKCWICGCFVPNTCWLIEVNETDSRQCAWIIVNEYHGNSELLLCSKRSFHLSALVVNDMTFRTLGICPVTHWPVTTRH